MARQPVSAPATAGVRSERYQLVEAGRGIACLAVLLFHSLVNYAHDPLTPVLAAVEKISRHGWLGVHAFFAISGWCIAERYALARSRGESARHFLGERCLRIFPTYWAAIAVTLALRLASAPFNSMQAADALPPGLRAWAGTLLLLDPYLETPGYLTVSWSLVFEIGFYVCAAAALLEFGGRRLSERVAFAAGAALCLVPWLWAERTPPWIVLGLWPNFFAGVAAWCVVRRGARAGGFAVLGALAFGAAWRGEAERLGLLTAIGTAGALALLHPWDRALAGAAAVRALLWVGGISYSLYLLHVPFLSAAQNLGARFFAPSSPWFVAVWLTGIAVALAAGWMLATRIELPAQRWRKRRPAAVAA